MPSRKSQLKDVKPKKGSLAYFLYKDRFIKTNNFKKVVNKKSVTEYSGLLALQEKLENKNVFELSNQYIRSHEKLINYFLDNLDFTLSIPPRVPYSRQKILELSEFNSNGDFKENKIQNEINNFSSNLNKELNNFNNNFSNNFKNDDLNEEGSLLDFTELYQNKDLFSFVENFIFNHWKSLKTNALVYERNLETWRQFWLTCERSDTICQVIDSRNKTLFFNQDILKMYPNKKHVLFCNKYDLCSKNIIVGNKEAKDSSSIIKGENEDSYNRNLLNNNNLTDNSNLLTNNNLLGNNLTDNNNLLSNSNLLDNNLLTNKQEYNNITKNYHNKGDIKNKNISIGNFIKDEIINVNGIDLKITSYYYSTFSDIFNFPLFGNVGLIGYPNVGKSSTINLILKNKLVRVSSTPGKTKQIQTINGENFTLLDCPGLVFAKHHKIQLMLMGVINVEQVCELMSYEDEIVRTIGVETIIKTFNIQNSNFKHFDVLKAVCKKYNLDKSRGLRFIVKRFSLEENLLIN